MNVSREEKKTEAIARMKLWEIFDPVIRQFEEEDQVCYSEGSLGACYWLEDDQMQRVREFEDRNNALVYHVVIKTIGVWDTEAYLYVSDHPEEWEFDRGDIIDEEPLVYVFNKDEPDFSEFGYIGVAKTMAGGLRRTY